MDTETTDKFTQHSGATNLVEEFKLLEEHSICAASSAGFGLRNNDTLKSNITDVGS